MFRFLSLILYYSKVMRNFQTKILGFIKSNRPVSFLILLVLIICFLSMLSKTNDYLNVKKIEAFSKSKEDLEREISELQVKMTTHTHKLPSKTLTTGEEVQTLTT